MTENIVTGKSYRILKDKGNDIWDRVSFWTHATDVEMESGKNLQEELNDTTNTINTTITTKLSSLETRLNSTITDRIAPLEQQVATNKNGISSLNTGLANINNSIANDLLHKRWHSLTGPWSEIYQTGGGSGAGVRLPNQNASEMFLRISLHLNQGIEFVEGIPGDYTLFTPVIPLNHAEIAPVGEMQTVYAWRLSNTIYSRRYSLLVYGDVGDGYTPGRMASAGFLQSDEENGNFIGAGKLTSTMFYR